MTELLAFIVALAAVFLCGVQLGKGWRRDRDPAFENWRETIRADVMGDLAVRKLRDTAQDMRAAS